MFIAAPFTSVRVWNQPRYPTTNEWIKKVIDHRIFLSYKK
jgi:hypothetical protein